MKKELKHADAILNSILEGPENIIAFSLDRDYQYIFFNEAHMQTMKNIWDADIEAGRNMLKYISYPQDREKAKINFDRTLSGENFIEIEEYGDEALSRNYWENIYNPIQSGNEIIGLTVFCIDITKRQIAEESLKESEEKFRSVSESAVDAIVNTDSKGIIAFFNHSFLELFGYSASEISGKPVSILIPKSYKKGHMKGMQLLKSGKKQRTGKTSQAVGLKKDGTQFPCEMSISTWKSGNESYFTSIIRDLTEQKKAEKLLRESEEKFRAIFQNASDMISLNLMNDDGLPGKFLEVNEVASERLGYTHDELLNMGPPDIVAPEKRPEMPKNAAILIEKGHNTFEIVHLTKTGERIPVEINNHLIQYKGREVCLAISRDITERKKVEELLLATQNRLRVALDLAKIGSWEYDVKSDIFTFDDQFYSLYGTTAEKEGGQQMSSKDYAAKFIPPEEAPLVAEEIERVLTTDDPNYNNQIEHTIIRTDGEKRIIVVRSSILKDENGKTVKSFGANQDITELKKAEKALRESEEKYRTIFENIQDIFYQTDITGKIIEISPSVKRYSKFRREDLIGKPVDMIYNNPEDRKKFLKTIHEKGEVFDYEIRLKDKDGRLVYASANAHFLFDSHNRPVGVEGSIRDINERKKAEEDLRLSQIRLANAMDLAHLANWELDISTNRFIFNEKFYSMLGTTLDNEGSYSMPIEDYIIKYVHPDDTQFIAAGMKRSLDVHESTFGTEFEHRIIRRDGETRYVAIHIRIIPATESQSAYIYGTVQDITERKIAEEKLKESLKEKEMLLKEIHHRVKNNLMVISSLLNLQSQYIKDKEALDIFKESQNRARSMALIHERLYRSTDLKRINFGDYIRTLANDLFHTYLQDHDRVKLNMNVENVMVDINTTVPLGLTVNELITNSMKHAFIDGSKGKINIDFHKEGDEFILIVSDTGVGFPADLDFRNTKSLGLQLVNSLVGQIDGEIELDRSQGTEFKITFKEMYK
ncbi:MAG TPA: PAS domain S-box protein [Methanobacteriaceae archaeon]|nr:PAS domain S-box protein [Methanobacteriaceae archaeon]